jgi:hypothetical protein|tara:strand:+ start:475 stop:657 length:183 start_codon:yes stop_codon:yes gene_type:complete
MATTYTRIGAKENTSLGLDQASFEETLHRTPDGVIAGTTATWRTRNNNKTLSITRKTTNE